MNCQVTYVSDFDQLPWLIDPEQYRVYECNLHWAKRSRMRGWLHEHCQGQVLIWNGLLSPDPHQIGEWGPLVSPDGTVCFFIFLDSSDESRFVLEHVGGVDSICVKVHKDIIAAYHNRRAKYI